MIRLESVAAGTVIFVRAQPGARQCAVVGEHDGALKIAVTAPPDKGKANEAIIAVLAATFDLSKSSIELISGHTSRQKTFLLSGMTVSAVEQILAPLLDD